MTTNDKGGSIPECLIDIGVYLPWPLLDSQLHFVLTLLSAGFLKSVRHGGGGGIHPHPITLLFEG